MGENQWFIRDGNWSTSFLESSDQIAWFLHKQLGSQPDVIVGARVVLKRRFESGFVNAAQGAKVMADRWLTARRPEPISVRRDADRRNYKKFEYFSCGLVSPRLERFQ